MEGAAARYPESAAPVPARSAALTAALAATGMTVPTGDDADAIGRIRTLMPPLHDPRQTLRAGDQPHIDLLCGNDMTG